MISELDQTIQGAIIPADISFDFFGFVFLFLMVVVIFLILLSSTIVGASLIKTQYLLSNHILKIEHLRKRISEKKLVFFSTLSIQP